MHKLIRQQLNAILDISADQSARMQSELETAINVMHRAKGQFDHLMQMALVKDMEVMKLIGEVMDMRQQAITGFAEETMHMIGVLTALQTQVGEGEIITGTADKLTTGFTFEDRKPAYIMNGHKFGKTEAMRQKYGHA